ncbi:MAG TPA: ABC transporter transmembrane domain-containing protein, partial [Anaerolineae bacterium]
MKELKRLIPFVKPYWRRAIVLALCAIAALGLGLLNPWFLGQTVDRGINMKDMSAVAFFGGCLMVSSALLSLFNYLKSVFQGTIGTNVVRDLRLVLYRKLQYLPFAWYTTMPTGQIMSRMISDMDAIEQFVAFGFTTMLTEGSTFLFTFIILLTLDWQLTLAILVPMPLMAYAIIRFRMRIDPAWAAVREQMGRLT